MPNLAIGASATTLIYLLTFVMKADAKIIGPLIAIGTVAATRPPAAVTNPQADAAQ